MKTSLLYTSRRAGGVEGARTEDRRHRHHWSSFNNGIEAGLTARATLPRITGVPYGCDGTKLSRAGIPCIIFAPGSIDRAHGAVEYVELDQVEKALDFYRRFLLEFGNPAVSS